ncbi:MFS transporter [Aspergillus mulundensis]|uniref:Autophagy-related protein n=1 Tax=Aspergillus mulundensis TaxID=1810919 RepID=A0A3D8RL12_9EURO|nr:Autophagy-related protein 22-1 [Aspergillus mulundensis]RDW74737.1 Autophagy-related protein 22-1 [Aspergillus mulundensis]
MEQDEVTEPGLLRPQYPGDDTRPTSKKELIGWYSYGWAAEVFTVCAMGSFLPITLEQMARERGVLFSDKTTPCTATWKTPENLHANWQNTKAAVSGQCIVYILGAEVNTASFAMYTFSVSVFIQAILIISMSGAADHGSYRKTLLVTFAAIGSISTMFFLSVASKLYLLGGLFAIVANTCLGASFVLLNSFLPLLVRYHPSLLKHANPTESDVQATAMDGSRTPLLQADGVSPDEAPLSDASKELILSTQISSYGIGIGYISAVLLQGLCILVIVRTHQTTFSLRVVLFLIGLWWLVFTIPAAFWLRPRPGPPLLRMQDGKAQQSWLGYMAFAWKSLGRTAMRTRHLKDLLLFLASWFLLSDGIATVSGTAVLFAKTQLNMEPAALGMINVITMISGVLGAFSWSYVSRALDLRASQTIIACILLFELVPLYGLLGFIPAVKNLGYLGLQRPWEMFPLGVVYGIVMGGLSSYCRSFFGQLIPPGYEASFYSLYAITDKGSSIFGPAIVGFITDRYGEIRPAFFFLAVLILLPLPLMLLVDADRGKRDALALSDVLEEHSSPEEHNYGTFPQQQAPQGS